MNGNNYILAIGIDKYSSVSPLSNAVKDVEDFLDVLTTRYTYEIPNIIQIYDEDATRANIISQLRDLVDKIKEEDSLIIYFSGHGDYDDAMSMGYWIPVDAELGKRDTYVVNTTVIDHIRAIRCRHIFLVADSCFSGALFSQNRKLYSEVVEEKKSRWALTSGRIELVSDGITGNNSPFASCLLEYLTNNKESKLPVSKLVNYVKITVGDSSEQTPQGNPLYGVGDEGGELVFKLKQNSISNNVSIGDIYYNVPNGIGEELKEELSFYKCAFKEDFERFVEEFPNSKFTDRAEKKVKEIKKRQKREISIEKFLFNLCKTRKNFEKYILLFPNGIFYEDASDKIREVDYNFVDDKKKEIREIVEKGNKEIAETGRRKIAEGKLEEAIKEILSSLSKMDTNYYNEILVLSSRFNSIKMKEVRGIINSTTSVNEYNRIASDLLTILNRIESER